MQNAFKNIFQWFSGNQIKLNMNISPLTQLQQEN